MANDQTLTQEQAREAAAYFNLASLMGRCISAAAFQIQHPGANPSRMLTSNPVEPPPASVSEDDTEDENEDEDADTTEERGPAIYSEVSINNQIDQLVALYTPGVREILQASALYGMFRLASSQFNFDEQNLINDKPSQDDGNKMAIAWLITKRVFAVRHMDEAIQIISATEDFNQIKKPLPFREMDPTDEEFITETCKLCAKIYDKEMSLQQVLEGLAREIRNAEKSAKINRLPPLGSAPNGDPVNYLLRVMSNGDRLRHSNINRHEGIVKREKGNSVRYSKINRSNGSVITVEIKEADKYLSKTNKTFKKILFFTLQKLVSQNDPAVVGFTLQEMVDLGMYSSPSNALRGVKDFYDQQLNTKLIGTWKKGQRKIAESGGILFYQYQIANGYVQFSVNEHFNLDFIASYYTVFPRFAYALSNNAFSLVRYIFFLARQNVDRIKSTGKFSVSLEAIRENLGLPAPEDVKNRRYKQLIIGPVEQTIKEIEEAAKTVPEAREYGFTIAPIIPDTNNINKWLNGYLEIGLSGDFAEKFVQLALAKEAEAEKAAAAKRAQIARLEAKKEVESN